MAERIVVAVLGGGAVLGATEQVVGNGIELVAAVRTTAGRAARSLDAAEQPGALLGKGVIGARLAPAIDAPRGCRRWRR